MSVIYYSGERIYFRPLEPADEPTLRRWINDPRVWRTLSTRRPVNECREREWIESHGKNNTDVVCGIVARDGDRLVGSCGLHQFSHIDHSAVFGLMIGEVEAQNHGYGSEATKLMVQLGFEEFNLHRIELAVYDFNPRAIRVYEKAGFVREGVRREAAWRDGQYRDVLVYSILRAEWEALRHRSHCDAPALPALVEGR